MHWEFSWVHPSWHPQSCLLEGCTVGLACGGTVEACLVLVLVDLRWAEAAWRQNTWCRSDIRVLVDHPNSCQLMSAHLTTRNWSHITSLPTGKLAHTRELWQQERRKLDDSGDCGLPFKDALRRSALSFWPWPTPGSPHLGVCCMDSRRRLLPPKRQIVLRSAHHI